MSQNKPHIDYSILVKILNGIASDKEEGVFNKWLGSSKKHERYFSILETHYDQSTPFTEADYKDLWIKIDKLKKASKFKLKEVLQYAAAIAIPLLLGISLFYSNKTEVLPIDNISSDIIQLGANKATIKLSNGSTMALDDAYEELVINDDGLVVGKDSSNTLAYVDVDLDELKFNTITTSRGGEYNIVLSDGTKVYLNADSEIKYPVKFIGDTRDVYIQGEAYFDVAHIENRPFRVHTDHSIVKVYGTEFNVMSYSDDKIEQITLVEGSVGVNNTGEQLMLAPGQQAELSANDDKITVKNVDVSYYTSWRDDVLKFKDMPLSQLAKKLSRWYAVDFFFANNTVSNKRFTGKVEKSCDFEFFMGLIEKTTNVDVTIDGRTVLVKEVK